MKKIIVILIVLFATPAFAWDFVEKENQMGDVHYYSAVSNDTEDTAAFSIMYLDGRLIIGFMSSMRFVDSQTLDIRVDDHKLVTVPAITTRQDLVLVPVIPEGLIAQIKAGETMLVRFYTQEESHVVKFDLEGAASAIDKLMEVKNENTR